MATSLQPGKKWLPSDSTGGVFIHQSPDMHRSHRKLGSDQEI